MEEEKTVHQETTTHEKVRTDDKGTTHERETHTTEVREREPEKKEHTTIIIEE